MKRLGISLPPWMDANPSQAGYPPPSIMTAGTHSYIWVKRDIMRSKVYCLMKQHDDRHQARTTDLRFRSELKSSALKLLREITKPTAPPREGTLYVGQGPKYFFLANYKDVIWHPNYIFVDMKSYRITKNTYINIYTRLFDVNNMLTHHLHSCILYWNCKNR